MSPGKVVCKDKHEETLLYASRLALSISTKNKGTIAIGMSEKRQGKADFPICPVKCVAISEEPEFHATNFPIT